MQLRLRTHSSSVTCATASAKGLRLRAVCSAVSRTAFSDGCTAGAWTARGLVVCTPACNSGQVKHPGWQQKVHRCRQVSQFSLMADANVQQGIVRRPQRQLPRRQVLRRSSRTAYRCAFRVLAVQTPCRVGGVSCAAVLCVQAISGPAGEQLQIVFMCSRETVTAMVSRWPGLASMNANDVLARLMSLKARTYPYANIAVFDKMSQISRALQFSSATEAETRDCIPVSDPPSDCSCKGKCSSKPGGCRRFCRLATSCGWWSSSRNVF